MILRNVKMALCCVATVVPALASAGASGPDSVRQKTLIDLLRQDCGSCHGMTLKGGLGPPLLPEALAGKDDAALADTIRNGVSGTPMPPWGFEISPDEARWLVRVMKDGLRND